MISLKIIQIVCVNISLLFLLIDGLKNIWSGNFSIGLIQSNIAIIGDFIISQ